MNPMLQFGGPALQGPQVIVVGPAFPGGHQLQPIMTAQPAFPATVQYHSIEQFAQMHALAQQQQQQQQQRLQPPPPPPQLQQQLSHASAAATSAQTASSLLSPQQQQQQLHQQQQQQLQLQHQLNLQLLQYQNHLMRDNGLKVPLLPPQVPTTTTPQIVPVLPAPAPTTGPVLYSPFTPFVGTDTSATLTTTHLPVGTQMAGGTGSAFFPHTIGSLASTAALIDAGAMAVKSNDARMTPTLSVQNSPSSLKRKFSATTTPMTNTNESARGAPRSKPDIDPSFAASPVHPSASLTTSPHLSSTPGVGNYAQLRRHKHKEVEVRRRRKLSSLFSDLAALLDLSQADKATVLASAARFVRHGKERGLKPSQIEGAVASDTPTPNEDPDELSTTSPHHDYRSLPALESVHIGVPGSSPPTVAATMSTPPTPSARGAPGRSSSSVGLVSPSSGSISSISSSPASPIQELLAAAGEDVVSSPMPRTKTTINATVTHPSGSTVPRIDITDAAATSLLQIRAAQMM